MNFTLNKAWERRQSMHFFRLSSVLPAALLFASGTTGLWGQASYAATKTLEVTGFGMVSRISPDFGYAGVGYTLGGDMTLFRSRKLYFNPSLEIRFSHLSESTQHVGETFAGGGLMVQHRYGRITPYGDLLIGVGFFHAPNPGESNDTSTVYAAGGGLNVDVVHHVAVKVDAQYSFWNLGLNPAIRPSDLTLTPFGLSLGLAYTFR